jgi:ribulose-5-phosphate 4-epimerase/fuculose-1-phosphate aldolase
MREAGVAEVAEELVRACKVLFKLGIVDVIGHMSVRVGQDRILIKPRPVSWFHLTVDDLILMDLQGRRLDNVKTERPVVREWPIHTEIYQTRPEVNSVLHCHPFDSVLMASLDIQLEPMNRDAMFFPGGVPVWDNRECLVDKQTMVETRELGTDMVAAMGSHRVMILKHHGIVAADRSVGDVVRTVYYLERAAKAHLAAAMIKTPPFMPRDLARDIEEAWTLDRPGFGLGSPSRVVPDEQWAMLKGYLLAPGDDRRE